MARQDSPEEEPSLPKQTVIRMAEECLPDGLYMGRDTRKLVVSCAEEFLHMLTFQANEICQKETKNGYIGLRHVMQACEELGFAEYTGEIEAVSTVYDQQLKSSQKKRAEKVGWWTKGTEVDELAALQAQMLQNSKANFEKRLAMERRASGSAAM